MSQLLTFRDVADIRQQQISGNTVLSCNTRNPVYEVWRNKNLPTMSMLAISHRLECIVYPIKKPPSRKIRSLLNAAVAERIDAVKLNYLILKSKPGTSDRSCRDTNYVFTSCIETYQPRFYNFSLTFY
jgi:hypothetical protein